jgi:hypothetical protein
MIVVLSRMLKKSASFVLASLDGLFEHPAGYSGTIVIREIAAPYWQIPSFLAAR